MFAGHQCVSVSVVVGATSSTFWVEPLFQAALLPLGNGGTQEGPPLQGRTGEPRGLAGERAGRTWQQTPPPPPPQSPTVAPKDVESDFITPRKRGKRRLSSDSSNSEGESLDSRTPLKMTRVGEDVMADTATTPPASPTDTIIPAATSGHDNVGKKSPQPADNSAERQPCPQTEAGLPLQKGWRTGTTIPKPARRQLAQEAIPAEYPDTGIRGLPGGDPRLRRRIGQVRQARTMAPQPASQQRGGSSALH